MFEDLSQLSPEALAQRMREPALDPPSGVEPNFEHPPNSNAGSFVLYSICLLLGVWCVSMRFYARWGELKKGSIVEILLIPASLLWLVYVAIGYHRLIGGHGHFVHQWHIRMEDMSFILWGDHFGTNLYIPGIALIKAAIVLEWLRIFVPTGERNVFWWASHSILWLNTLFYAATMITMNLACIPFARIYDKAVSGRCIDTGGLELSTAVINLVVDVLTMLLPQRTIWGLQMSQRNKIGISFVFGVGLLACASAAARVGSTARYLQTDDRVYYFTGITLSALGEQTCGLLVLCVPAVPKALAGMREGKFYSALKGLGTSILQGGRRTTNKSGAATWESARKTSDSDKYEELDELPLAGLQVQTRSEARSTPPTTATSHHQQRSLGGGILRTTQFSTSSEERIDGFGTMEERDLHAPWKHPGQGGL